MRFRCLRTIPPDIDVAVYHVWVWVCSRGAQGQLSMPHTQIHTDTLYTLCLTNEGRLQGGKTEEEDGSLQYRGWERCMHVVELARSRVTSGSWMGWDGSWSTTERRFVIRPAGRCQSALLGLWGRHFAGCIFLEARGHGCHVT